MLSKKLKSVEGVEQVLSIPDAITLHKNVLTEKLRASSDISWSI